MRLTPDYLNQMSTIIHEQNKKIGWWDDKDRCLKTASLLIVTELSEAVEAWRKDKMDDHLPNRKGEEVELADALIRLLDLGGKLKMHSIYIDYELGKDVDLYLLAVSRVVMFADRLEASHDCLLPVYESVIDVIMTIANQRGYDLISAMEEKIEYNKNRADHKRENRAKVGGKKF